jgi:RNA methyltransferase, TrmH family
VSPARSGQNRRIIEATRLHRARQRRETGLTLIEGPNLLQEAMDAGIQPLSVFALEGDGATLSMAGLSDRLTLVDDRALARLAGTRSPRGPVAVIEIPLPGRWERSNVLVSWGVSDPGNVGALIRVAAAFAWDFGYVAGSADPWSPKTLRAGAGAQFRLAPRSVDGVSLLADEGYRTVASVVRGGEVPEAVGVSGSIALLIGEEASGLPSSVSDAADFTVTVPMPGGLESLNAAVAAGVLVYAMTKTGGSTAVGV